MAEADVGILANGEADHAAAEAEVGTLAIGGEDPSSKKRFEYLLKSVEIFHHFITNGKKMQSNKLKKDKNRNHRVPKKLQQLETGEEIFRYEATPDFIRNGEMREYQIKGLNWLISLYETGINGILADEMGLGKTLQTISFLGHLKHKKNIKKPFLVIVPNSTIGNWMKEVEKWCPSMKAIAVIGERVARKKFIRTEYMSRNWDVCITTYEMCYIEKSAFKRFTWGCLVIDEAHRIKNDKALLSETVRELKSNNRLLLTGTPLQNNLHELWSLLNFLLPDIFNSSEDFDAWFDTERTLGNDALAERLHALLKPFLLRRLKSEVEKDLKPKVELKIYVGLAKLQREWYKKILMKEFDAVTGLYCGQKKYLLNILMQLRKCANHPYLFHGAEPGPPYEEGPHLIMNSGKMLILDKLLYKLKSQGSRVLIFSQFTTMLDIIEDYCNWRKYEYCRLDGSIRNDERNQQIEEYNKENSSKFLFLLSTRAGGLGINLATADSVIIYDSDWNPQVDLQAMDRVHRIGQKKQVRVFRLVAENTVDQKVIERAEMKLRLDKIVIQRGGLQEKMTAQPSHEEMMNIIQFGAQDILSNINSDINDEDIDVILERGKMKTTEENLRLEKLAHGSLQSFTIGTTVQSEASSSASASASASAPTSLYLFEGEDYSKKRRLNCVENVTFPEGTRRKTSLNVDNYLRRNKERPEQKYFDFQFFPKPLYELANKELRLLTIQDENGDINNGEVLSGEEKTEMMTLLSQGFENWNKNDFQNFIKALKKYGRYDVDKIIVSVKNKSPEEVRKYYDVFWKRKDEIKRMNVIMPSIEKAEAKLRQIKS